MYILEDQIYYDTKLPLINVYKDPYGQGIPAQLRLNAYASVQHMRSSAIAEGSRTIIAEKSPFWSKYPFVAWNT